MATQTAIALVLPTTESTDKSVKNWESARADLFAEFHDIGEKIATAQLSKTQAAYRFNRACRDGLATVAAKGSDDAERAYMAIANAHNAAIANRDDVDPMPVDPKVAKPSISLFRGFGKPEVVAQGVDWFARICAVRTAMGARCKLSAYLAMAKANSAVVDESKKMIGRASYIATDSDIESWIEKSAPKALDPIEAMEKHLDSMRGLSQDYDWTGHPDARVIEAMLAMVKAGSDWISAETQRRAQ